MPPKKAASTATAKKPAAAKTHGPFKDMIADAIRNLKERNGSSRQSIKKYVQANNKINSVSQSAFDVQFNRALKTGVEKEMFTQPKGPSGPVKLAKKEPAPKTAAPKKAAAEKKEKEPKKPATKKASVAKTAKTPATKKAAAKPKANTAKARKAPEAAPAVVDEPKVLGKTKSGRVTKQPAKTAIKKAPAKKASATKKATPAKKAATPKKAEA